jgi:hypothetical protein
LLKTIIDRVELRPNGLRMILSLVPLTPAAAPPNRLQGCVFPREFPLRVKRRGVEMRFAIDAPDPRATNPDPVLLKEAKRARRCFDALVSGGIGSVAELARLEGISDRYEALASVVIIRLRGSPSQRPRQLIRLAFRSASLRTGFLLSEVRCGIMRAKQLSASCGSGVLETWSWSSG